MSGRFRPSVATVWLALHSYANMRDGARPAISTVMELTGLGRTAVKDAIRCELVPAGVLRVVPRGDGSRPNSYLFPETEGRFTRWPNLLWDRGLNPHQVVVLLELLSVKDLRYGSLPPIRGIAQQARAGTDSVRRAIEELQQMGLLAVERPDRGGEGRWRRHRYTFPWLDSDLGSASVDVFGRAGADTATCDVPSSAHPYNPQRPPLYLAATTRVPDSGREEHSLKNTDQETLREERLRDTRAARGSSPTREDFEPPAAEPGAEGDSPADWHRQTVARGVGQTSWQQEEKPPRLSSSNYRNILWESAGGERIVTLWEELRGPAASEAARQRWVVDARHLLADRHPLDEVLWLTRWVAADRIWSARVKTPASLRQDSGKRPRYEQLLAEARSRDPRTVGGGRPAGAAHDRSHSGAAGARPAGDPGPSDGNLASLRARLSTPQGA